MERVEAVRSTGIANEIIIEEYEGQKIDDIKHYNIDVFTVGSDWKGKFDYLDEYCRVVYLDRTQGVSSSELRAEKRKIGIKVDNYNEGICHKFTRESEFVNGVKIVSENEDAYYITSRPEKHYYDIKKILEAGKSVICESPLTDNSEKCRELFQIAKENQCILMDGIKTAYSTAYNRLLLLVKSGKIGDVISVDSTCTSLRDLDNEYDLENKWNSISAWGPTALLPVFQILGTNYLKKHIVTQYADKSRKFDGFTKIDFIYEHAVASIKVAKLAKSEGELIISGTKGYIYVPAPWWKTDYFEIRYENTEDNRKYFYQLEGEGIRNEIVLFQKSIEKNNNIGNISDDISVAITKVIEDYYLSSDEFMEI
jgi:choline-phosphate cytidylyltransferase